MASDALPFLCMVEIQAGNMRAGFYLQVLTSAVGVSDLSVYLSIYLSIYTAI